MSIKSPPRGLRRAGGLPPNVLELLDRPGPRYTSYPTADRFGAMGAGDYGAALAQRQRSVGDGGALPIGLYIHVPFCESVCYYCACNKVVTRHHARAADYLQALEAEMTLHAEMVGYRTPIASLHLGGGSPTFLSDAELAHLMRLVGEHFTFAPGAELAIEVDQRTADVQRLAHLHRLGFSRLSLGVQDTEPQVQRAIHRVQSTDTLEALRNHAQALGFESVNFDLMYGLPRQSLESFDRTLEVVARLRPDRLALYAYAHLPARFKPQRRILEDDLPRPSERLQLLERAIDRLLGEGYVYIGMDHFALPTDALAIARHQGRLHRNFQGYTATPDVDVMGLGPSAIGRIGPRYFQNHHDLGAWQTAVTGGQFATNRGCLLTRDDLVRRSVIMALMCQGEVAFESIELAHLIRFPEYFAQELIALERWQEAGMVRRTRDGVELTDMGWFGVRAIAMEFDAHRAHAGAGAMASRLT